MSHKMFTPSWFSIAKHLKPQESTLSLQSLQKQVAHQVCQQLVYCKKQKQKQE